MSSSASISIKAAIIMAAGHALSFDHPILSVFQSGNSAVNGRIDLFVLTGVSSSNGYTMMLVLTRRHDQKWAWPHKNVSARFARRTFFFPACLTNEYHVATGLVHYTQFTL